MTPFLLILAILLGFAPGMIAHGKGRNFFLWWIYGVVLGPVALIHAMLLHESRRPQFATVPRRRTTRWESPWPLLLWAGSSFAVAIVAIAGYDLLVPGKFGRIDSSRDVALNADRSPWKTPSPAPQQAAVEQSPPAAMASRPEPDPAVRVTIRRDEIPLTDQAQARHAEAAAAAQPTAPKPDPSPPPAPAPSQQTAAAEPPAPPQPPASTPSNVPLERTLPMAADPAPEQKTAPIADVRIARVTPPQTVEADAPAKAAPESPVKPAKTSHAIAPKSHADRKPVAAKPTPTDVNAVGEIVRTVQQALAVRGYDPGPANGRAGRQTQLAIRKFQLDRGLAPTGAIDYAVLENLNIVGPRVHAFQPPPGATAGR